MLLIKYRVTVSLITGFIGTFFAIVLFSSIMMGIMVAMPAEGALTFHEEQDTLLRDYLIKITNESNVTGTYCNGSLLNQLSDYYGNDIRHINKWTLVHSVIMACFMNSETEYENTPDVREKMSAVADEVKPLFYYKKSRRTIIHEYDVEKEDPETGESYTETVVDEKTIDVYLLIEARTLMNQVRYDYRWREEMKEDGSKGTYIYIYEEVSSISNYGQEGERLASYLSSKGFSPDTLEEGYNFVLNFYNSYENKDHVYGDYAGKNHLFDFETIFYSLPGMDYYQTLEIKSTEKTRENLVEIAEALIGLPYFWGGKYESFGANPEWGTPTLVSASGNRNSGKVLPLGLDCSGFVDWVYYQLIGETLSGMAGGGGAAAQYVACRPIDLEELEVGDLGFYANPYENGGLALHVGIYIGDDANDIPLFIHAGGYRYRDSLHPEGQVVVSRLGNDEQFTHGVRNVDFKYFGRTPVKLGE
jgi:cell wall-associated NlpC family hydrolase